jgi:hypothetical protein
MFLDPISQLPHFQYFDIIDENGNTHTVKSDDSGCIIAVKDNELRNLIFILCAVLSVLAITIAVST